MSCGIGSENPSGHRSLGHFIPWRTGLPFLESPRKPDQEGTGNGSIGSSKNDRELIAPLSGSITERNREALEDPYQVNQDPYGKGWLCVIECEDWETESKHLITGEAVEAWSEKEMERYRSQGWID